MRRLSKLTAGLLSLGLWSGVMLAQGSGAGSGSYTSRNTDAYTVTRSITGTITKINNQGKTLVVREEKKGTHYTFTLGEKTKLKASQKVLGKKKIEWSDLAAGQRVRVKFKLPQGSYSGISAGNLELKEIKVLAPKST